MSVWRWLEDGEEFPPHGRFRVSLEDATHNLVDHQRFANSQTRGAIWEDMLHYLAVWARLQGDHAATLDGRRLLHYAWIGGSFASSQMSPDNLDFALVVDGEARDLLFGKHGCGWLSKAFNRTYVRDKLQLRLSPLKLIYRPVVSPFVPQNLTHAEREYLQTRGGWDDWWQRCRDLAVSDRAPTVHTAPPRRGYVEVTL